MDIVATLFSRRGPAADEPACGATDPGRVRDTNEDGLLLVPERGLYAVADGMGGHKAGEVASASALKTVGNHFTLERVRQMQEEPSQVQQQMGAALNAAHNEIRRLSETNAEYGGMGSTIALAFIQADVLHTCHVGDSRVYIGNASGIRRVTTDHSEVWELVRAGAMSAEEARISPLKNRITQALGSPVAPSPEYTSRPLNKGDRVLLCTDGLWDMLPDETIRTVLTRGRSPARMCRDLIAMANKAGGEDNITVIVVHT